MTARQALYALGLDEVDVQVMRIELLEAIASSNAELLMFLGAAA